MPLNQMQLSRKVDAEIREEHQVAMLEVDRFFRMKMLLIVKLALPLQKHRSNPEPAELKQARDISDPNPRYSPQDRIYREGKQKTAATAPSDPFYQLNIAVSGRKPWPTASLILKPDYKYPGDLIAAACSLATVCTRGEANPHFAVNRCCRD